MDEEVRAVVEEAATLFREYEIHHNGKKTVESMNKARRNREMAMRLEALLQSRPELVA